MNNFDISVSRFDEYALEYASRFMDMTGYSDSIDKFCEQINSEKPDILELACGPGNITQLLQSRFPESRITGVDLAPKMIEIARKRLPKVNFLLMDVRHISSLTEKFDAIMCSFCLPFLSNDDAAKLISDCSHRLKPGGALYISTMEGDETKAGFETTSFSGNSEIYFNYHQFHDLAAVFRKNGFILIQEKRQDYIEPDGSRTQDMIFIGVKHE